MTFYCTLHYCTFYIFYFLLPLSTFYLNYNYICYNYNYAHTIMALVILCIYLVHSLFILTHVLKNYS